MTPHKKFASIETSAVVVFSRRFAVDAMRTVRR
jgi:hypothetical protein